MQWDSVGKILPSVGLIGFAVFKNPFHSLVVYFRATHPLHSQPRSDPCFSSSIAVCSQTRTRLDYDSQPQIYALLCHRAVNCIRYLLSVSLRLHHPMHLPLTYRYRSMWVCEDASCMFAKLCVWTNQAFCFGDTLIRMVVATWTRRM